MALELVRKIVSGHWRYVVEEEGGGGAAFNGGTITEPLTIEAPGETCLVLSGSQEMEGDLVVRGVDPLEQALTVIPAGGSEAEGTRTFAVQVESGITVFNVDASGWTVLNLLAGAAFRVARNDGGGTLLRINENSTMGFFGATPVARPTGVAVTAEAIHAALVSLGLIAGP